MTIKSTRSLSFSEAQKRLKQYHPELILLDFTKAREPAQILCPVHGPVTIPRASEMLAGRGCNKCGRARAGSSGAANLPKGAQNAEARAKGQLALQANDALRAQGLLPPRRIKPTAEQLNQINLRRIEQGMEPLQVKTLQNVPELEEKPKKLTKRQQRQDEMNAKFAEIEVNYTPD